VNQVFLWVPAALYVGVRPSALLATLIVLICCIWGGASHSFGSLEASRIIGATASTAGEVLPAIILKDVFYLHERGGYMGLYMVLFQSSPTIGLLASGFLISAAGWRWYFWVIFLFP
jgi:MFS family permease